MFEHGCKAWDLAALVPILEEAGGMLTNWEGKKNIFDPAVLASNGRLHQQALELLQKKS